MMKLNLFEQSNSQLKEVLKETIKNRIFWLQVLRQAKFNLKFSLCGMCKFRQSTH